MPVSILILADNNERDLPACLESVGWSDDVHVLDWFSSDRTAEIAVNSGARVTQRKSVDAAVSLNAALDEAPFKYPWLLLLEPNERVTAGLEAELKLMVYHRGPERAYHIRRRQLPPGRVKDGKQNQLANLRFFSWDSVRYVGGNRAVPVVDGPTGELEAPLDHLPLAGGVSSWLEDSESPTKRRAEKIQHHASSPHPAHVDRLERTEEDRAKPDSGTRLSEHPAEAIPTYTKLIRNLAAWIKQPGSDKPDQGSDPADTSSSGGPIKPC